MRPAEPEVVLGDGLTVTVRVDGDVDLESAPLIARSLEQALATGRPDVVVDLEGTGFMDSSGLNVLVTASKRARALGRSLRVIARAPQVSRLFEITGLAGEFGLPAPADGRQ